MATIDSTETDVSRAQRYQQAAELLRRWQTEDAEYDEQVGATLDSELATEVMRCRDDQPTA